MKNLSIFILALGFSLNAQAYGIISVTKTDKGLFGYKEVSWNQGQNANSGQMGWVGLCQHPGLISCRPPSMMIPDSNDEAAVKELLQYAEDEIDHKNFNGNHQVRIKVDGEDTLRIYTVTWQCDNEGNGTINMDREDE